MIYGDNGTNPDLAYLQPTLIRVKSTKKAMLSQGVKSPSSSAAKLAVFQDQHNNNKIKRRNAGESTYAAGSI